MGFLNPALLLVGLAAAVPIVLHLMRRREVRRVVFPAVRYLRRAERQHARRLRLRHLLLLAARVSIILLLAAAAAGPLIGRGGAADHEPTAVAIVVDESQSAAQIVDDRRLFDRFRTRARRTLELANGEDRIALFAAAQPEAGPLSRDPAGALALLDSLVPAAAVAELPAALRQATAWLRSQPELELELHLLTDLQAVSLNDAGPVDTAVAGRGPRVVVYVPDHTPAGNAAVGEPTPEVLPLTAGQPTRLSVPLHWFGAEAPADSTIARLVVADEVVYVSEAPFGAQALLTLPAHGPGWVQGYVEVAAHGLAADDRRYFSFLARPPVRVATPADAPTFLDHALDALERGGRLIRSGPAEAEVWVAETAVGAEEALGRGASLVALPPVDPLDLPRLNFRLERALIPWRYAAPAEGPGATRLESAALPDLDGLEVRRAYRLVPTGLAAADRVLARSADGEPWLVRGIRSESAVYILLASPLTPEASDLPVSAAMVPFMDALLGDIARRGSARGGGGGPARFVALPSRARELLGPDGFSVRVEGGAPFRADAPGNYAVLEDGDTLLAFSVNAPLRESDLQRGAPAGLEANLPAASWTWQLGGDLVDWEAEIYRARRGRQAWRPLVAALLLFSIVEASLAAAGRRRREGPAQSRAGA